MGKILIELYLLHTIIILIVFVNDLTECQLQSKSSPVTRSPTKCISSDWIPYKDIKCLKILNLYETHSEALKACQDQLISFELAHSSKPSSSSSSASGLLMISSKEEETFIDNFLFNTSSIAENIWLSAVKNAASSNYEFSWPDGTSLSSVYTNWAFSNPSQDPNKSCVELRSLDNRSKNSWSIDPGSWYNVQCSKHNLAVCQYLIRSLPSPQVTSQLTKAKKDIESLQNKLNSMERSNFELKSEVNSIKKEITDLNKFNLQLKSKVDSIKEEITDLNKFNLQLKSKMDSIKEEIADLNKFNLQLKSKVDSIKEEVTELNRMMHVLLENVITDLRFGKLESTDVYYEHGFEDGKGYVLTGAINWDGHANIDKIQRRRVQKFVNGKWLEVY